MSTVHLSIEQQIASKLRDRHLETNVGDKLQVARSTQQGRMPRARTPDTADVYTGKGKRPPTSSRGGGRI
ncbi:hypothetical protein TRAPUB_7320 [Trametes pubescens]|uniref:Uncharacterized protein n=1 Tax=Trametes pubescens TaxID=154538 RepID=A0A1M2V3P1_TRAPU|nr:hypothetical protein TRAPUB_7320 [Trametes pubescens]